ncbi:OsmC family protein [Mariniluteicoccus endophyticus]
MTTPAHNPDTYRSVTVTRESERRYRVTTKSGATLEFGQGEGLVTPVELLLAAIAGCSSVDVDNVTTRRAEPEKFEVVASGDKLFDDELGAHMANLRLAFDLEFPDTDEGRQAASLVERCVRLSQEKNCTVSRTVELGTPVEMVVE